MTNYTPFDKELENLDEHELQKLIERQISEGWYVEYKSELPKKAGKIDNLKIAKSISAFANTKGGWLFFGIETDTKNIATNLCGIELSPNEKLPDQISQIISSNISPEPIFHFKTVSLKSGKFVFVIEIEESPTPPYITSQGIVYQRENNESNPIKDRYILEKLSEKTANYYESIERFCNMDYGETKGQADSNQPYLELYFFPLPYNESIFNNFQQSEFFKQVAIRFYQNVDCTFEIGNGEKVNIPLNLNFNSIYSSQHSLIIRPIKEENLIYKTTTVELFANGSFKFLVPLFEFDLTTIPKHYKNSKVIEYLENTYSPLETVNEANFIMGGKLKLPNIVTIRKDTDFVRHIRMIDGTELIYILMIVIAKYRAVLNDFDFKPNNDFGFRARLTNTWRKFVFFDNADYLEKIKLYNIPISPKNEVEVPKFVNGNFYVMDINEQDLYLTISRIILTAIGLPDSSTIQFLEIINSGLNRFNSTEKF